MPRGLGFATATTSAAFFPHCEQRSRGASVFSVVDQPTRRAGASGSMDARHRARSSRAPEIEGAPVASDRSRETVQKIKTLRDRFPAQPSA
jgi:hypothetical protein